MSNETEKSTRMKKISKVLEYYDEVIKEDAQTSELIGKLEKLNLIDEWIEAGITRSDDEIMEVDTKVMRFLNLCIQLDKEDNSYSNLEIGEILSLCIQLDKEDNSYSNLEIGEILNKVGDILLKSDDSKLSIYVDLIEKLKEIASLDSEEGKQHQKVYK